VLRTTLATERNVPAYIVFSDVALRQMAREYPTSEAQFRRISGVGEKKLGEFGAAFLCEINEYLKAGPRKEFAEMPLLEPKKAKMNETARDTLRRFRAGKTVEEIARERELVPDTIYGHLARCMDADEAINLNQLLTPQQQAEIAAAYEKSGLANITGALELLGGQGGAYSYGMLTVYRAAKSRKK
jgi:ATP-dependent DNA helicase RecQ